MKRSKIVRVWGIADTFDIEFNRIPNTEYDWEVIVPPDLSDGQYAVEIHAINEIGLTAIWTGILYMASGRLLYLRVLDTNYRLSILQDRFNIDDIEEMRYTVSIVDNEYLIRVLGDRLLIRVLEDRLSIRNLYR